MEIPCSDKCYGELGREGGEAEGEKERERGWREKERGRESERLREREKQSQNDYSEDCILVIMSILYLVTIQITISSVDSLEYKLYVVMYHFKKSQLRQ